MLVFEWYRIRGSTSLGPKGAYDHQSKDPNTPCMIYSALGDEFEVHTAIVGATTVSTILPAP